MAKKVPFDDPQVLTYVRMAYVATQVTVLGVYYYVGMQVRLLFPSLVPLSSLPTRRFARRTTRQY